MASLVVPQLADESLPRYARAAGIAMLLSIVFGAIGEAYLPGRIIVSGNAAATAANIVDHPTLFRLGFAAYMVEGICDVALCVFFYVLLRPVNRHLALLSAFFGIASMVTFAVAESAYFASALVVRDTSGMESFTTEQRNALALLSLHISAMIANLFLALYGIATMIRGHLIMRSRYFPSVFGVLFIIGGAGFFLRTTTFILAPAYGSDLMLLPMAAAGIPFMLWLLIRGVQRTKMIAWLAAAILGVVACTSATNVRRPDGWISLFDGQTLTGWRASENPATFSVANGEIVVHGPRAHLFYEGPVMNHEFKDFELEADVMTKPSANSGIFIRTTYQDTSWPSKGYEVQVNNSHSDWRRTGSLYAVQDVREAGRDNEWFTMHVIVRGRRVQVLIDGRQVVDYTEPNGSPTRLTGGTIALQGHDPGSEVHFRNIMIRALAQ